MRLNKRDNSISNLINLSIIGCGFTIIIYLAVYLLNYRPQKSPNYSELKLIVPIIQDNYIYNFVNEVIILDSTINRLDCKVHVFCSSNDDTKVAIFSYIKRSSNKTIDRKDKRRMCKKFSTARRLWDNTKLKNCEVITNHEIDSLKNIGQHCDIVYYSIPIFNTDSTFAIIEEIRNGRPITKAFKKHNNSWLLYETKIYWNFIY